MSDSSQTLQDPSTLNTQHVYIYTYYWNMTLSGFRVYCPGVQLKTKLHAFVCLKTIVQTILYTVQLISPVSPLRTLGLADLVEHGESGNTVSLLKCWTTQSLSYLCHTSLSLIITSDVPHSLPLYPLYMVLLVWTPYCVQAYSTLGLMNVLYACSLITCGALEMFLLIILRFLLAFDVIFCM